MKILLVDHVDGCTPLKPCLSCQAAAFLKGKLAPADFDELVKILQPEVPPGTVPAPLSTLLSALDMPTRASKQLGYCNIRTIGDVLEVSERDLLGTQVPNFGRKSLNDLKQALAQVGHKLGYIPRELQTQ
jgi:DNA-directed RNA polymerase alpha subunit